MNDALLCYLNKIDEFSLLYTHLKFVKIWFVYFIIQLHLSMDTYILLSYPYHKKKFILNPSPLIYNDLSVRIVYEKISF